MGTKLVGRERELSALEGWLADALAGGSRVALCRGEPGIGKTRLAEALSAAAVSEGAVVAWGLAVESAGAPPYWPWRQVLDVLAQDIDLTAIAAEHRLTPDLARLAPDVFAAADEVPGAGGSDEDRFRLFDAVTRLLRLVARIHPLVIVLDDAQWADPSSLLLLQHVVRSLMSERLLMVVNYRSTEPLHRVLVVDLPRERVTRELEVRGLSVTGVRSQLTLLVGSDLAESEAAEMHARTGGNPFFVEEICWLLAERRPGALELPVTASVREAIAARLCRLPEPAIRILEAAAIAGREFSLSVVAGMVGSPEVSCLAPLDAAVVSGLVEAMSTLGGYRFVHDLIREGVESGLGTAERVELHRKAAEVLEQLPAKRLDPHLPDLARHWAVAAAAGQRMRAVGWIRRAGEQAMHRLAYDDAARLFRIALATGADELDDVSRCELLLATVGALKRAGTLAGRLEACEQAATLAKVHRRPDLLAAAALALEGGESDLGTDLTVRRLCLAALVTLDRKPSALRASVWANLSTTCMYLGDVDTANDASHEALTVAEETGDPAAIMAALQARQLVCSGPDGLGERSRIAVRMLALGRDTRNPVAQLWAQLWQIDVAFQRGDLTAVARELEHLAWSAEEVGGPVARWHLLQCRAVLAQAQARFADGCQLADQALAALSPAMTGYGSALTNRDGVLFTVSLHTGDAPAVAGFLQAGNLGSLVGGDIEVPTDGVIFSIAAARLLAAAGLLAAARTVYRRLGPPAAWRPIPHATTVCYAFGIATAIALDASDDVDVLRKLLGRFRGHHVASGAGCVAYGGPVELFLGVAGAHLGLLDNAVTDLEGAARACASNGADGFHTEARYELAAVLARRAGPGDLRRAQALAADVAKQAKALGMAPWAERAHRLAERLDGQVDPLTPREHEVAALVAVGLTNREIATRLYLSERTAQNHVQHILTKLDLPNRSQVAVWFTTRNWSRSAE